MREILDRESEARPAYNTRGREREWIKQHRDEYLNQWVAVEGDALIAHGADARTVADAARAAGIKAPFMERVRESGEPFCGGWL